VNETNKLVYENLTTGLNDMKKKTSDTAKILKLLMKRKRPVSAASIANQTQIAYDSVSKRVHDLRNEGYDITTTTRKGVSGASETTYLM
jgi:biotin operon repressor